MFLSLEVDSFESLTCRPSKYSCSVHLIFQPSAVIYFAVFENHLTLAFSFIIFHLSCVFITIAIVKRTWYFLVKLEFTLEDSTIRPCLSTLTMTLIFNPLALISASFYRLILTNSMWFIIFPLSIIVISIRVMKPSFALSLSILKHSTVIITIREIILAIALFLSIKPLPKINNSFRLNRLLIIRYFT